MGNINVRVLGLSAILLLSMGLAGCAGPESAEPTATVTAPPTTAETPAETPPETPVATPSPDTTAPAEPSDPPSSALVIPDCDDLLTLPTARSVLGDDTQAIPPTASAMDVIPGPVAVGAVRTAAQSSICLWGIPNSDGGFHVVVAELSDDARDDLIAALRSAGTFTESVIDGAPAFTRDLSNEIGTTSVAYVFDGPSWVTAVGSLGVGGAQIVAGEVLDAVQTANP